MTVIFLSTAEEQFADIFSGASRLTQNQCSPSPLDDFLCTMMVMIPLSSNMVPICLRLFALAAKPLALSTMASPPLILLALLASLPITPSFPPTPTSVAVAENLPTLFHQNPSTN